jgi:hypothetical protein
MALLTDGFMVTTRTEGIALDAKLRIATEQIQLEIAAFLLRTQTGSILPANHSSYDLSRVVVTAGLQRWHTLRTLVEVYSDAYNSQLNDRYLGKWKHFAGDARDTVDLLFELGIGLVNSPVPRAPKPTVTEAGSGGPATTYYVQVGWRNGAGAAGAPSEIVTFAANEEQLIQVDAGGSPVGVTGWDVFVGSLDQEITRQNGGPIPAGDVWLMPAGGLISGPAPGNGQSPDFYARRVRVI